MCPINYSRGSTRYDNSPVQMVAPYFDAFEAAVLTDRAEAKGQQYIAAPMRIGPHLQKPDKYPGEKHFRCAEYAEHRGFHPQDCDGFKGDMACQAYLQNPFRFRGFGYTTASHKPAAPRMRAIFALSRPVSREEGITLGMVIQEAMLAKFGVDAIRLRLSRRTTHLHPTSHFRNVSF